jgi:hypothetical protein
MLWVGFEPTIPASERAKTVHALDRSVTVTDTFMFTLLTMGNPAIKVEFEVLTEVEHNVV